MARILHLSDFHFGRNYDLEESRLEGLASFIDKKNLKIDFIVFTGDLVDALQITKKCLSEMINEFPTVYSKNEFNDLPGKLDNYYNIIKSNGETHIEKYNFLLEKNYKEAFDVAGKIFRNFIDSLGIPGERVIICCGNHDRIRKLTLINDTFECDSDIVFEDKYSWEFSIYNEFCSSINKKMTYRSNVYEIDNMNFVIANSNWKAPENNESNGMCINCGEIERLLLSVSHKEKYNRNNTVFVAHKPFDDICENAKFTYQDKKTTTTKRKIEDTAAIFLYGDKHSYEAKIKSPLKEFMCGVPLSSRDIRCNLIDSNDEIVNSQYILLDNHIWKLVPNVEDNTDVYNISKDYLKLLSLTMLKQDFTKQENYMELVMLMKETIDSGRLDIISNMFSKCATFENEKEKIHLKENIFDNFIEILSGSETNKPICVKGYPGTGKSTYLTLQYIYMFYKFCYGTFRYVPFYINLESFYSKIDDKLTIEQIIEENLKKTKDFIDECFNIGEKNNLPICIILDGLEGKNMSIFSQENLESRIYEYIEIRLKNTCHKCIMSFNTYKTSLFNKSFDQIDRFEHVMFLNSVRIVPYKRKIEKGDVFLSSYLGLYNCQDQEREDFKKKLRKLHFISVDFNFLHRNSKLLLQECVDVESWDLMRWYILKVVDFTEDLFGARKIKMLQEVAYFVFYTGITYEEIKNKNNGKFSQLSYSDFMKIINNYEITNYLIAKHYVEELVEYSVSNEPIHNDSILRCFITRDLFILVRLVFQEKDEIERIIKNFIENHSSELNGFLYSSIAYLIGHIKSAESQDLINYLDSIDVQNADAFFDFCSIRSSMLAKVMANDDQKNADDFVGLLMDDEDLRLFNRSYQLHYYGDVVNTINRNRGKWTIVKVLGKGLDFYKSFLILISKLNYGLENNEIHPLMIVDLYTLCDMVYSRLQEYDETKGLFYSKKYNDEKESTAIGVLSTTIGLIDKYLNISAGIQKHNNKIISYFELMLRIFSDAKVILEKNTGKDYATPLASHSQYYDSVVGLSAKPRVGWDINHTGTVDIGSQPHYLKENIINQQNKQHNFNIPKEYIMQHIIESVYIAQMFLPNRLDETGYSKEKVISLILLSELGKADVGDFSPYYSNAKSRYIPKELNKLKEIMLLGTTDGYANNCEYFDLLCSEHVFDINKRICDEIKVIQTEYKYYELYDELDFDIDRRKEFEKDLNQSKLPICKSIRQKLISNNPRFIKYFQTPKDELL